MILHVKQLTHYEENEDEFNDYENLGVILNHGLSR